MDGGDGRIVEHFGHGLAAEAVAFGGGVVGEDGKMYGRVVKPCEFQGHVVDLFGTFVFGRGFGVLGLEVGDHPRAQIGAFDVQNTPRAGVADGGGEVHDVAEAAQDFGRNRVGFEVPYIAPPRENVMQRVSVGLI